MSSSKCVGNTPTLNGAKVGLGKQYVAQLTSQLDLQFALTLKFMDQTPLIADFDKTALDKLLASPPEVREETKNKFTEAVNLAVAKAKMIAEKERP
jgi:hypothetical protein